jgi:hypothetical protein
MPHGAFVQIAITTLAGAGYTDGEIQSVCDVETTSCGHRLPHFRKLKGRSVTPTKPKRGDSGPVSLGPCFDTALKRQDFQ